MSRVEEIKQQAIRLMADKGFEAMSLRQLAAAVGMRSGSIYTHYQSKSQLLQDVCCDYQDELMAAWLLQRKRGRPAPEELLLRFAAVYLGFCHAREDESRVVNLDFRSLEEPGRSQVAELRRRHEAELADILLRGGRAGTFEIGEFRLTLLGVLALLHGFAALAGGRDGLSAFESCVAALQRVVGMHPSAPAVDRATGLYVQIREGEAMHRIALPLCSVG